MLVNVVTPGLTIKEHPEEFVTVVWIVSRSGVSPVLVSAVPVGTTLKQIFSCGNPCS